MHTLSWKSNEGSVIACKLSWHLWRSYDTIVITSWKLVRVVTEWYYWLKGEVKEVPPGFRTPTMSPQMASLHLKSCFSSPAMSDRFDHVNNNLKLAAVKFNWNCWCCGITSVHSYDNFCIPSTMKSGFPPTQGKLENGHYDLSLSKRRDRWGPKCDGFDLKLL